jgi:hypothetical protein
MHVHVIIISYERNIQEQLFNQSTDLICCIFFIANVCKISAVSRYGVVYDHGSFI